jgi:uncharacterized secreted repeat protein (TIGR03808 family)
MKQARRHVSCKAVEMKESPLTSRRDLLRLAGASAFALMASRSFATTRDGGLRGAIDAADYQPTPGAPDRKRVSLQKMIDQAAAENAPVFLPPGTYKASNLVLRENTRITGVPGVSRIVYTGGGNLFSAEKVKHIELSNIIIDGQNRSLGDDTGGLLQFTGVAKVIIDNCEIANSRKHAVRLERCGGRITGSRISGSGQSGIYAVESDAISITGNEVFDCGNGGILVHRWTKAADNSVVNGNRIYRIKANDGGTAKTATASISSALTTSWSQTITCRTAHLPPSAPIRPRISRSPATNASVRARPLFMSSSSLWALSCPTTWWTVRRTASRSPISTRAAGWRALPATSCVT